MSDILSHTESGVLTLTLHRPDRKNSLTRAMYSTLADALDSAAADAAVRVVVLQGSETVFSAGNDISEFVESPPSDADAPVFRFIRSLAGFPKPVLAAVCGPAVGIGTTLLFHCDLVYAGDNAAFSMPFVNLGLSPEAGATLLVPRMFGYHRAAEALLLGEPFLAEAAQEVGLVNRVVPPSEASSVAAAQARKLASKPLAAIVETKRLMKLALGQALPQSLGDEAQSFARLVQSPAALEAFAAFMENRRPDFSSL